MEDKSKKPSHARRAILRGSLAAPVVLTVSSPAAAVSSLKKCLDNQAAQDAGPFISSNSDTWLRRSVPVYKLAKDNGDGKATAGGKNNEATDWVYYDEGLEDFVTVAAPNTRMNLGPLMKGWKKTATETRWGLVWVDEKSGAQYPKFQIQRPSGYTLTSGSCWASVT